MGTTGFTCVILAAGEGRRAGGPKPLFVLGEGLVVDRVVESARSVCSRIRVVGGCGFDRLRDHVERRHPGVEVVLNPAWESGMFSSVRAGLAGVEGPVFVHPVDVPGPGPAVYSALAAAYDPGRSDVVRPVHAGRAGHPVLLAPAATRAVLDAPPGSSLREAISGLRRVDVDVATDLVLLDFDTLQDLETLRQRLE